MFSKQPPVTITKYRSFCYIGLFGAVDTNTNKDHHYMLYVQSNTAFCTVTP